MKRTLTVWTLIVTGMLALAGCSVPLEGIGVKPSAPGKPVLSADPSGISISWGAVPLAESYYVYYGTSPNVPDQEAYSGGGTKAGIRDYKNGVTYYVRVRAENERGLSPFSETASITLTLQPPVPVLTAGNSSITVSWEKDPLADSYNVYHSTDPAVPEIPYQSKITEKTSVPITGLINGATYYVWVEAVNPGGKAMSERKSITLALQPPVPKIETGTGSITVSWEKVPFADSYKVYYGTDPASPGTPYRSNITGETSIPITGLINDTTYYVWVEAVNANGSKMSERKSITLTLQPPVPELEVGNGSITVSWEKDPLADSYNVYRSTDPAVPGTPYQSNITEKTSVPIIGLINGTTYYVWVEAVNAKGSKMSEATSGVPKLYSVEYTVNSEADFTEAVTGINASLKEGEYHITIGANITTSNVSFSATSTEKTIIIEGDTSVRTISNNGSYNLLTVNDSNILILQNNITLNGNNKTYRAVQVNKGGTLVMKTGSRITGAKDSGVHTDGSFTMEGGEISGNTSSKTGGGVYAAGGAFTMSGGTISGNTVSGGGGGGVFVSGATFTMSGGKITGNRVSGVGGGAYIGSNGTFTMTGGEISENTASGVGGGGVSVAGTFTMSGGTISGNKAPSGNGGGVSSASGRFIKSGGGTISSTNTGSPGRVVYVSASKRRETTAGPGVYMDSQVNGSAGGWE